MSENVAGQKYKAGGFLTGKQKTRTECKEFVYKMWNISQNKYFENSKNTI